jgi:hypothetical protein
MATTVANDTKDDGLRQLALAVFQLARALEQLEESQPAKPQPKAVLEKHPTPE